jgi:hypothetical protein
VGEEAGKLEGGWPSHCRVGIRNNVLSSALYGSFALDLARKKRDSTRCRGKEDWCKKVSNHSLNLFQKTYSRATTKGRRNTSATTTMDRH